MITKGRKNKCFLQAKTVLFFGNISVFFGVVFKLLNKTNNHPLSSFSILKPILIMNTNQYCFCLQKKTPIFPPFDHHFLLPNNPFLNTYCQIYVLLRNNLSQFRMNLTHNFSSFQNWFINDATGINQGYALNTGSETCITDSTGVWEFYDFGVGDWVPDPTAQTVCVDEVPPPPEEQCNTGSLCDGCVVTLPFGDTVYCCKEQCQYGWINYDPNTNPMCQCGV